MKLIILTATGVLGIAALSAGAVAADHPRGAMFDRLDADDDGEITQAEVEARRAKRDEKMAARFAEMDTDGSGSVSREEMTTYREAKRAERNPDKNDDGVIDRTEFLNAAQDRFDRLDENGDGVLSEEEKPRRHGMRSRRG